MTKKKNSSKGTKDPLYNEIYSIYLDVIADRTREERIERNLCEPWLSRRIQAMRNLMPVFHKRYKDILSVDELTDEITILSASSMMSFDLSEKYASFSYAAALWMLDEIYAAGKLSEAKEILEQDRGHDVYKPYPAMDTTFGEEIIEAVLHIIQNRDATSDKKYNTNYLKKDGRHKYILDAAAATGETKSELHRVYRQLLDMIPEEHKEAAAEKFKNKILEWLDIYIQANAELVKQQMRPKTVLEKPNNKFGYADLDNEETFRLFAFRKNDLINIFLSYSVREKKEVLNVVGPVTAKKLARLDNIDNPYEYAFAIFYMIEKNDDWIWAGALPLSVELLLTPRMTWFANYQDELPAGDDFEESCKEIFNIWHRMDYSYPPKTSERLNLAQIVYAFTGFLVPRDTKYYARVRKALDDCGVPKEAADLITPVIAALRGIDNEHELDYSPWYEEDVDELDDDFDDEFAGEEIENNSKLLEEIDRLKKEVDNLKGALHETSANLRKTRNELDAVTKEKDTIRVEAAGLREVVFTAQNEDEPESSIKTDISFPYTAKGKIVVFGGHDSWVREMKLKLPDVKFVDRGAIANIDLIRNADKIWVQTNAIPHRTYNTIMSAVRQYDIPLRYFASASPIKCAIQFAEDDREES